MKIGKEPSNFVDKSDYVVPDATLEKAAGECDAYVWFRAAKDVVLCQHKDSVHVIQIDGVQVGCSCGAMTYQCPANKVCKHLATFLRRETPPTEPVPSDLSAELRKAGWTGTIGDMHPPDMPTPTDDLTPALGAKAYERECPYCGEITSRETPTSADAWLKEHMTECDKNPNKKEKTDMKKKTQPEVVDSVPPINEPEPEKAPATETPPPTPPDTSLDADVKSVIEEAEGFGATNVDPAMVVEKLAAM